MTVDPLLLENTLDKILIRDYTTEGSIGVLDKEKAFVQPIRFNINLYVKKTNQVHAKISEVLDYRLIIELIERIVKQRHYDLQEELAEIVANEILKSDLVRIVNVRIEKPLAFDKAESVGVEILRRKM